MVSCVLRGEERFGVRRARRAGCPAANQGRSRQQPGRANPTRPGGRRGWYRASSGGKNDSVFVVLGGRAVRRPIKAGRVNSLGVQIQQGLVGGEDVIVSPP